MNNKSLLISIVTVAYNDALGLEQTIESVIGQSYDNIEYIIIDGGSTDETVDIIKKNETKITSWVSEKDKGIYDAMNKGMALASGDFLIFMNAGDIFYEHETIDKVVNQIADIDKAYFGRANIVSGHTSWLYPNETIDKNSIMQWLKKESPNHQAIFFPKIFYTREKYNLNYKIFGDAEYKYRAQELVGFCFIDIIVCNFLLGGLSSRFNSYKDIKIMMKETWTIGREYRGILFALKRIFVYNIKYILRMMVKEKLFLGLIKKIRS